MNYWHHLAICAGLVAVAIALVTAGDGDIRVHRAARLRADDRRDDLDDGATWKTRAR
jgi:membrane protein required for beta-lactamase induction